MKNSSAYICEPLIIDIVWSLGDSNMAEQVQYYSHFLLKNQKDAQAKRKERQQQEKGSKQSKIGDYFYSNQDFVYDKKMTNDEIIEMGKIIRVKSMTLTVEDFRVQVEHEGTKTDAIASREEIIQKNVGALLDYYEKQLKLKDQYKPYP